MINGKPNFFIVDKSERNSFQSAKGLVRRARIFLIPSFAQGKFGLAFDKLK